jgi:glycosyltransferase involved in cell wall biosynthesis
MDYKVILGLRSPTLGGVEVFSINLARGLVRRNIPSRILITRTYDPDPPAMKLPEGLHVDWLPVHLKDTWRNRWRAMIHYLEKQAPCIFIPNNDSEYSCVSPRLSRKVAIVGVLHADEFFHYEHVMRLGKYWNGIVAVSKTIAENAAFIEPQLGNRLVTIPCGVQVPKVYPKRNPTKEDPLRIIYAGRLVQQQKRIMDLHAIVARLLEAGIRIQVTIVGDGPQRNEFESACRDFVSRGTMRILGVTPNEKVLEIFEQQDVILLTSDFEGLPVCLLEAMGRGCIPVVTDIRSGIPEIIQDDWNGYIICHKDIGTFVQRIRTLREDLTKRQSISMKAYETIRKDFQVESMVENYIHLFERVRMEAATGIYERPSGPVIPPVRLTINWKDRLPTSVRNIGVAGKNIVRDAKRLFVKKPAYAREPL